MTRILLGIAMFSILFSSCRTNKDLIYLQDISAAQESHLFTSTNSDYKVQISDVLYIRIFSQNMEIANQLNPSYSSTQSNTQNMSQNNLYFQGYVVNDSGYVKMPLIGLQSVVNKTELEIEQLLAEALVPFVKDAIVLVKLAGMKITILGEVKNPGMHYLYQKQATIFDALAIASDLTDYANRSNILLLRATPQGTLSYRVNINEKGILTSPGFFLQANDLIYVEPVKTKGIRLVTQDYASIISAVTTTLTAISSTITAIVLINSLLK